MANEKNLVKGKATQIRSGEEAARKGKKGGKASGESRRKKKTYRELTQAMLSAKVDNEEMKAIALQFGIKDLDVKTLTLLGMIRAAAGGSHNAFDRLVELSGENESTDDAGLMNDLLKEFKKI